jgi:hypothetical protein
MCSLNLLVSWQRTPQASRTNGLHAHDAAERNGSRTSVSARRSTGERQGRADLLGELGDGVRELVVLEGGALGAAAHDLGRPRPAAAQAEMAARPRGRGGPPRTRGRRVRKEGGV